MPDFPPVVEVPVPPTVELTFQDLLDYDLILMSGRGSGVDAVQFPKRCLLGSADDVTLETYGYGIETVRYARYKEYNNHYQSLHDTTLATADHKLYKCVDGSFTQLGQEAVDLHKWIRYRYKFEVAGTSLKCYRTDMVTPKISVTDTAFTTGLYGIGCYLADDRGADQKFFEVKVNGTDYDEAISLANVFKWHLFPAKYHGALQHVNTITLGNDKADGWTEENTEGSLNGLSIRFAEHANHYWVDTNVAFVTGDFRLGKSVNGTETVLGVEAVDLNRFDIHKFKISVVGTTLTGYRDDVTKFSVTDTSLASGKSAVFTWHLKGDEYVHNVTYG